MIRKLFKVLVASAFTLMMVWLGYAMIAEDQIVALERTVAKEYALKQTLESKYAMANNLDAYKAQLKEMEVVFGTMLELLPGFYSDPDVYAKLVALAKNNSVILHEYKHLTRLRRDFYAEDRLRTKVTGKYPNVIHYLYEVQNQGQVMSLSDYTLRAYNPEEVLFEGSIKVYSYLERDEIAARKRKKRRR